MTNLVYLPLPSNSVAALLSGGLDANGQVAEQHISTGVGPCRHCLNDIEAGDAYLICAYRPFKNINPYAEIGPIFLHAKPYQAYQDTHTMPKFLFSESSYIIRGYNRHDRIVYGSGQVIQTDKIPTQAQRLFDDPEIDYIQIRSSRNNCFLCTIVREN